MNSKIYKTIFFLFIISTAFSFVYLNFSKKEEIFIDNNLKSNNIITYDNESISIDYTLFDNYFNYINKYYNKKSLLNNFNLLLNDSTKMYKDNNYTILETNISSELSKKIFNNYTSDSDSTNVKVYFDKDKYNEINVTEMYNEINKEDIIRNNIVNSALKEVGNDGEKYYTWYGFNHRVEWCAVFVSYIANLNGVLDTKIPKFVWVKKGVDYYKERNLLKKPNEYTPKGGDLIFFDWNNNGVIDHVGFVEKVENDKVYTIEGNVSRKDVRRKNYPVKSSYIYAYGVLDFSS